MLIINFIIIIIIFIKYFENLANSNGLRRRQRPLNLN